MFLFTHSPHAVSSARFQCSTLSFGGMPRSSSLSAGHKRSAGVFGDWKRLLLLLSGWGGGGEEVAPSGGEVVCSAAHVRLFFR